MLTQLATAGWSETYADDGALVFTLWVARREYDAAERLSAALRGAGVAAPVTDDQQDDDWRDGLRRHHHPIDIGERLRVRPPWVAPIVGVIDVVIDPGMAFGTGQHATTRGCLELLLDVPLGRTLDVGCGTGVLAIAAAKLGHAPVMAIDNDPLATEATARNAQVNEVMVDVALADGADGGLPSAELLLANITRLHIAALAGAVRHDPPQTAILSGFVEDDVDSACGPWRAQGFVPVRTVVADGWAAVRLDRPQ